MRKHHETKLYSRNLLKGINNLAYKILVTILKMDERPSTNRPENKNTNDI